MAAASQLATLATALVIGVAVESAGQGAPAPETRLAEALAQLEAGDATAARTALDEVDAAQRGFGWKALALRAELALRPRPGIARETRLCAGESALGPPRFSPDGARIAAAAGPGLVVWSARSGGVERELATGGPPVAPAFSPTGGLVLAAAADGVARVLELASGAALLELAGHAGGVAALAWSGDGARCASGAGDGTLRLWDADGGAEVWSARGHAAAVTAVAFDPAGARVASASRDGTLRVWDLRNGAQVHVLRAGSGAVLDLAYDARGARLASAHEDGALRLWDTAAGTLAGELDAPRGAARALAWERAAERGASRLAAAGGDGRVRLWDAARLIELLALPAPRAQASGLDFAPDGTRLALACADGCLRILETDADVARTAQGGAKLELPTAEEAEALRPLELDGRLRVLLLRADLDAKSATAVLELARANLERDDENGALQATVGAALLRAGRPAEALDELVAAHEKRRGWPFNLAFRALALEKLGRHEEAKDWARRFDVLLSERRWSTNSEALALRDELRRALP